MLQERQTGFVQPKQVGFRHILRVQRRTEDEAPPRPTKIKPRALKDDGDFRSEECVSLLQQADIVVTNPPFSLFREYVGQLVAHKKKFIIIGSQNAITYKDIFHLIKENKIWLGNGFENGNAYFKTASEKEFANGVFDAASGLVKFRNVVWYTNLDIAKRHEELILFNPFTPEQYPIYDNYDAIEVGRIKDIPADYDGVMGVPITFLDRHNPDQFEIVGTTESNKPDNDFRTRVYTSRECRDAYQKRFGKPGVYDLNASAVVGGVKMFKRVLIRRTR
jgi:hypothetical protein